MFNDLSVLSILFFLSDPLMLILFILLITISAFVSIKIIFVSSIYLFVFLFYIFILFLLFNFNQYVGIFFIIEITTILFITAITLEFKYVRIGREKTVNLYYYFFFFLICISSCFLVVFSLVNYRCYDYCLLNSNQTNSMIGIYFYVNSTWYMVFIGISFIIISHILILLFNVLFEYHLDEDHMLARSLTWFLDQWDFYMPSTFKKQKKIDILEYINGPDILPTKQVFKSYNGRINCSRNCL